VAKSQEYALLGRNEKFENNVVYPLRKPVLSDSPRVRDVHTYETFFVIDFHNRW
jgi:hypothetical protein